MSVETGVQPALSQSSVGQSEAPTQHQISSETINETTVNHFKHLYPLYSESVCCKNGSIGLVIWLILLIVVLAVSGITDTGNPRAVAAMTEKGNTHSQVNV